MAQIIKDGITFNSYKTTGVPTDQWPFRLTGQQGPDEDGGIINAVDIDWNNAKLGEAVTTLSQNIQEGLAVNFIKTTGDLLTVIAQLQAQVNSVTTLTKSIYNALINDIMYSITVSGNNAQNMNIFINDEQSNLNTSLSTPGDDIKISPNDNSYSAAWLNITYEPSMTQDNKLPWNKTNSYWYFEMPNNNVTLNVNTRQTYHITKGQNSNNFTIQPNSYMPEYENADYDQQVYLIADGEARPTTEGGSYTMTITYTYNGSTQEVPATWSLDNGSGSSYWCFNMPPYDVTATLTSI